MIALSIRASSLGFKTADLQKDTQGQ